QVTSSSHSCASHGDVPAFPTRRSSDLHGFYGQRSGDVIVVFEPYSILFDLPDDPTDPRSSATHGSPYSYDTHVPLIIMGPGFAPDRKSTRLNSSHVAISYAVFCLKKKT